MTFLEKENIQKGFYTKNDCIRGVIIYPLERRFSFILRVFPMQRIKNWCLYQYYRYLGRCASRYLSRHQSFTIGINGSVGKTSCRMIIYQTLKKTLPELSIYTSPKNFNGELGMSLSILQIESWEPNIFTFVKTALQAVYKACFGKKGYDLIVLEYGIDRPGEMDFLLSINKPHIGVFTAIDAVHSEQFGNPTAIAQEEIKMVQNTREIAFLNRNDHYAQQIEGTLNIDTFWYQTDRDPLTTDIRFSEIKYAHDTSLPVQLKIHVKQDIYLVQTNLLSNPNYAYLGVAITIAEICHLKYTGKILNKQEVLEGGLSFILQPGRANLFAGKYGSILLDSTYNASPLSMRRLIDTTIQLQKALPHAMKIMLILGDMRELGDLTEQEHRLLAAYVQQSADQVVLLGKSMHQYLADELKKI